MGSVGGDQSSYPDDAGAGERAGSASGHAREVIIDSLLPAIGEVGTAGRSILAIGYREKYSIKTALPKLASSFDFSLWKRRFEDFAVSNDCMQAVTSYVDMPVGDPPDTSRFFLDQGVSETRRRRARSAWTC